MARTLDEILREAEIDRERGDATMASVTYVVFGAGGHVGGAIADRLLAAGKQVRVVARSAEKLQAHARRGAEVAAGDVSDGAFVRRALQGAQAAFVLLPPYAGPGIRAWQDRVAGILGDGLEANQVPYAVSLSSVGADRGDRNGPIAGLHALEGRLDRIRGLNALHLRPGFFFENHLMTIGMVRGAGANGGALRGDVPFPQIATRDIGEVAATRLLALDWKGRQVRELHGQRDLSMAEATAALGAAIGKPGLKYVQLSDTDAQRGMVQAGMTEELTTLLLDMWHGFNEGHVKLTQPRSAATTTPTRIEDWAAAIYAPVFQSAGAPQPAAHGP
jgi:uncharacterized protein YbjT (DUF2867 family)